jgi:hypothetical protein
MIDEVGKTIVDFGIGDQVVVVKDEHQLARFGHEFGAQRWQHLCDDVHARDSQHRKGFGADRGLLAAHCLDEVSPKT